MRTSMLIGLAALLLAAPAWGQGKKVDCKALDVAVSNLETEVIVYTASKLRLSMEFEELTMASIRRIFDRFRSRYPERGMDPPWLTDMAFKWRSAANDVLKAAGCPVS